MSVAPQFHEPTFGNIALSSIRFLNFELDITLRDMKSDRGPYAITAGVFYKLYQRMHRRAVNTALVKMQFGPTDREDARLLCTGVESLLKRFEELFLGGLHRYAFDLPALLRCFVSEAERSRSIASECAEEIGQFERYLKDTADFLEKWDRFGQN